MTGLNHLLGTDQDDELTVRGIMVSTLTGSATIKHRSQDLGNDTDHALLMAVRDWADVVLVGAGTVRAEDYGGVQPTPSRPRPAPIAVLSRGLDFDFHAQFFHNFTTPPIFLTPRTTLESPALAPQRQLIEEIGGRILPCDSPAEAVSVLRAQGFNKIACEGGPSVLGALIEADLIDVMHLTFSPILSSRVELPLVPLAQEKEEAAVVSHLSLEHTAVDEDSTLFLRYRRIR
ncbi:pyrimidine reductase family protein [Corynebacterium lowii]|uniref:5-amino-6-(5-phosphoribosylamino)uracil reductase n=1 Tax=Corynebacterium lowii TaxID=1544413 RepID=A0A0Q1AIJ2_9CORY|nr:pyrimidine reductase family protein [Corynebacterium lowii]KQB86511.1 5-amino-6-(5-phosphoribosylamino)uracil reductase [Corynebacterium lowii]MDP9851191.1 riboflavin biosynthesis pyrimidine reductase [Corynebacterium lowii]